MLNSATPTYIVKNVNDKVTQLLCTYVKKKSMALKSLREKLHFDRYSEFMQINQVEKNFAPDILSIPSLSG